MNQSFLINEIDFQRRNQEVLKEAESYRLVREAEEANKAQGYRQSRLVAWAGKKLLGLSEKLEQRHSGQMVTKTNQYQHSNSGD